MPPIARVFIVGMLLVAGAASAEDFKSQAAAAAAIFDDAFKAGDAAKVRQLYTKGAIILPAGGQSVKGPAGAEAGAQDETPIKNGKISGDDISFSAERPFGTFNYIGKISGAEIKFKMTFNDKNHRDHGQTLS